MTSSLTISKTEQVNFDQQGFLVVDELLDSSVVRRLHDRFDAVFAGEFETGVSPDEVNWQEGSSDPSLTRQICNGWKADGVVASVVHSPEIGRAAAKLARWPGARLAQDNLLWKPPGSRSIGFHRDNAYATWLRPQEMLSCWIALDDVSANTGTVEFAAGSHHWSIGNTPGGEFHAPDDYMATVRSAAANEGADIGLHALEVPAGGGSFHHGWLWHGSGPNSSQQDRRGLVVHCISSEARFHREGFDDGTGPIYSRFARPDDDALDEHHFPILWTRDKACASRI